MIDIALQTGFELYVLLTLLLLAGAVVYERLHWGDTAEQWTPSAEPVCFCRKCHHTFLVRHKANLVRCPRCRNLCRVRPHL